MGSASEALRAQEAQEVKHKGTADAFKSANYKKAYKQEDIKMANTTFTHIANATEFANIANYIKTNASEDYSMAVSVAHSYNHNHMEYTIFKNGIECVVIDGMVTTLYPDGSIGYKELW